MIDPFNGTGTTGAVAKRLGRRYIGFERDQTYATAAEARIAAIEPLPEATLAPFMTARDAPRVAFSELIERGMISPGTRLVDFRKRHGALVRADGAIMLGDKVGSIHRIGAVAQGSAPARLDLLAYRDQEGLEADRRAARRNPLRNSGGLAAASIVDLRGGRNAKSAFAHPAAPLLLPHVFVACAFRKNFSMDIRPRPYRRVPIFLGNKEARENF